jgi:hypothetical protein
MTTTRPRRPVSAREARAPGATLGAARRLETWLWTGPLGHLIGGGLDFGQALGRYLFARVRGTSVR